MSYFKRTFDDIVGYLLSPFFCKPHFNDSVVEYLKIFGICITYLNTLSTIYNIYSITLQNEVINEYLNTVLDLLGRLGV
jgi:hypothetical protein